MQRNTQLDALKSLLTPRIAIDIVMSDLPLNLSSKQYAQFIRLSRALEKLEKKQKFAKWKPHFPVSNRWFYFYFYLAWISNFLIWINLNSPKQWWKFAINCHLEEIHQTREVYSFKFLLERARLLVGYVKAYEKQWNRDYVDIKSEVCFDYFYD